MTKRRSFKDNAEDKLIMLSSQADDRPVADNSAPVPDSWSVCLVCGKENLDDENAISLSDRARYEIFEICMACYAKLSPVDKLNMHREFTKAEIQNRTMVKLQLLLDASMDSCNLSALFRQRPNEDN